MKKCIWVSVIFIAIVAMSCKKAEVLISNSKQPAEMKLTYEVITSDGKWFGEYNDKDGKRAYTNMELENGWKNEIIVSKLPFTMFVNATSSCICFGTPSSPDVTINFYINGKLAKTEKNNWAKGVTSLEYKIDELKN